MSFCVVPLWHCADTDLFAFEVGSENRACDFLTQAIERRCRITQCSTLYWNDRKTHQTRKKTNKFSRIFCIWFWAQLLNAQLQNMVLKALRPVWISIDLLLKAVYFRYRQNSLRILNVVSCFIIVASMTKCRRRKKIKKYRYQYQP